MAYQALYRVWRSQRFDDVVGQKAITQTLKNAITQKKTSHAYLFTGPRGTGKTSAAKIFAKAINCPNSQEGEPCNECEMCQSITAGSQEDVIEIDAASNNGVEEIRFIRDRANYAPTKAAYKVYIIDEVHMLSTGAFNALLKTLEEPKEHVIFILATTEPHKIPLTIISRTQRFDFKRINAQDIVDHLKHILQEIDIAFEEQALYIIARAAEGGMRDALSILDQAISYSDGTITTEHAMQVTGSLTFEMMDQYVGACVNQEVQRALTDLEQILSEGKEARRFLEDLLLYCRDLLMYQQAPQLLSEKSGHLTEAFKALAGQVSPEAIYQMIQILSETQNEVRFTNNATIYLEVATVKLATPSTNQGVSQASGQPAGQLMPEASGQSAHSGQTANAGELHQLQAQVAALQKEVQSLKQNGTANGAEPAAAKPKAKPVKTTFRVPTERVFQVLAEATKQDLLNLKNVWDDVLMAMSVTQRAMLKSSEPVAAGPNSLVIAFEYEIVCQKAMGDEELSLMLSNTISRMIPNYAPTAVYITRESWPAIRQSYVQQNKHQEKPSESFSESEEEMTAPLPSEEEVAVEKAKEFFGEELLTIIDD
ncbi:DNA polymerase III subunit gamma/tau [Enterococcus sp. JM4C]|uniref:DNA polymerase III subunit gamma/tau n=1 Tax=Candidatus Enterococcus huntleyi TaxID=1857217 RepID=UPI00137A606D|nr:DNA polymerase III subunit gamma/tau [Enterococcus sp. JM4C]KAF1297073.1 DNA polymerase III subunit gamma/tau [Enterococcus sp. JM4C]